jgi:hypothetical protein
MKTIAAVIACALAAGALAQEQPQSEQKPRPALNLRLDDATYSAPRVTFGPPASTQTKEDREKGLPEMGGKPSDKYTRQVAPSGINRATSNSVIPSAMDPNLNRE